jgi:hypothetical protein
MNQLENQPEKITSQELIQKEVEKLILTTKETYKDIKKFAIGQMWKILQLVIAAIIQIIEIIGNDLSSVEKKELALNMVSNFYDTIFLVVDIPGIPSFIESYIHKYVKALVMIFVSSTIDSMVRIFREVGVFKKKLQYQGIFQYEV